MKTKITFTLIVLAILFTMFSYGQVRSLRGQVTTFDSIPLIGASIKILSSKEVVLSDSVGTFSLQCQAQDKIKVTANGFIGRKVKVSEDIKLVLVNLNLKATEEAKEIATGYGHVKDKDKLFAMASINNKEMDFTMYRNVFDIISGKFPGVTIVGDEIRIRGITSINSSNAALLIVDGMTVDASTLNSISTSNIKNINVLKDASAAQYGLRGANGVVIIETKRGGD